MNDTTTGAGAADPNAGATSQAQPQPGNSNGRSAPLALPPIFDRMPSYTMRKNVRAVKISGVSAGSDEKTKLHFHGGYFPAVEVEAHHDPLLGSAEVNHYLVIEEDGSHHVVPAEQFEQHFKLA
ncbi:hypothetical protein [Bradyrhizobium elkanii]|uniref:Uncharacterized protein n=1 Tax=Bradyrhizobium elkanii TaxID=29448 RepID=A0A8I2C685_BRAEL|nr:hypothetical protein [Bradyrhizobium elkanii]MBP1296634.1 hypothetical protein [Bradyrhizobium elkanii]